MMHALALLLLSVPAMGADIPDVSRVSAFSWQCQNTDGTSVSNHNSDLEAYTACAKLSFKDGKTRYVQGGRWRVVPDAVPAPPVPVLGSAAISWSAPTKNTDGSNLTDLAGYRVYHGTSAAALTDMVQLPGATLSYTYGQLASGTHYFAVTAYNTAGVESALSAVGSKAVP